MTKRRAKQLACLIVAYEIENYSQTGASSALIETWEDQERIENALEELRQEMLRRAGDAQIMFAEGVTE